MTELRWHPAAAQEARSARRWYKVEQDAPDAAERFHAALRHAIAQVRQAPQRWPVLVDDLRKRPLHGFPFRVVYQDRGEYILIVAVMHERQRPEYWRERIG